MPILGGLLKGLFSSDKEMGNVQSKKTFHSIGFLLYAPSDGGSPGIGPTEVKVRLEETDSTAEFVPQFKVSIYMNASNLTRDIFINCGDTILGNVISGLNLGDYILINYAADGSSATVSGQKANNQVIGAVTVKSGERDREKLLHNIAINSIDKSSTPLGFVFCPTKGAADPWKMLATINGGVYGMASTLAGCATCQSGNCATHKTRVIPAQAQ